MFLEKLINNTLNSLSGVQEKIKDNQNLYEKLEEVLKSISIENLKVEDYEKARDNLKSIYENGFFRHKYSRITSYLINISQENPKAIEIVINNLEQISNKEKENSENTAWQKKFR